MATPVVEIPPLTEEQKKMALELYPTMTHPELVKKVFGDPTLDSRSAQGRLLKTFVADLGLVPKTIDNRKDPSVAFELTEDDKRFIEKNIRSFRGKTLELARVVGKDEKITPLSNPFKQVYAFLKEVYPEAISSSDEPVDDLEYKAPSTIQSLITLVNDYVTTGDVSRKVYVWGKLKSSEERCMRALMKYMRVYRVGYQASRYEKKSERELFLSTFIRFTHDKPDLTEIEVDQSISAAAETVNIAQIERTINRIDRIQEEIMMGGEVDENGKTKKLGMSDVEMINAVRSKYDAAKTQLAKLMANLEETRSKRQAGKNERNQSILNILEAWQQDEQKRTDLVVLMGDREKAEDEREVGRLRDLDDLTALISGQTEDEMTA